MPPDWDRDASVEQINPLQRADWNQQVASSSTSSFFHGAEWARVLIETYGHHPIYLVSKVAGSRPVILPTMEVYSRITGRRGVSMPFSDECALNGINAETFALLFRRLFALGAKRRWKHYECRGGRGALGDVPSSVSFHGHKLSLEQDSDQLFARLQGAARTAVRKAQNSALTIEAATSMAAMKSFYDLLCQTRRKHGVPPQPLRFFENIHRHIIEKKQGIVILAKSGVVPVAGAIFFSFGDTAVYKFAASNEAFRHTQGNNLVLWEGMRHYAKQGLKFLDFGRTSLNNPGLRRFKLAWGSQEHRIDYFRYDFGRNIFSRDTKDRSSGWHAPLFKVLPTKISRLAGLALYPHLA